MRFGRLGAGVVLVAMLTLAPPAFARDAKVTSFDGTKISTHFFAAEGLKSGARAPTVLLGHGYGQTGETDPNSSSEELFGSVGTGPLRRAGFNVLTWDARGFGESGGNVEVDSPAFEGRDVQALITFVSQQPEAQLDAPGDPRMGMAGVSYGGGIQLVTAAIDKRVDAITPTIAWNSLLTALYKDATVKEGWGLALSGAGGTAFTGGLPGGETGNQDPQITQAIAEGTSTGKFSDKTVQFFDSRGPRQLLSKVKVPTLLVEGTADTLFTLHESVQNFAALSKNGIPLRMMWFCGGHGVCLGNNGPDGRIESAVIGWLRYYVQRDHKAKLPPKFSWLTDDDGQWHSSPVFPVPARAPLTGKGSGVLDLQPGASSQGAFIAASAAADAVNVDIAPPARVTDILGEPHIKITYSGTAAPADTRLYAQVLDQNSGRVLGNQVVPIPVTLDGKDHTVERSLEAVATRGGPNARLRVQVAAGTSVYDRQRSSGAVQLKSVEASLPTVDVNAVPRLRARHLYGLARAKRTRAARLRVRALNGRITRVEVRLYKLKKRGHKKVWVRVGRSKRFSVANKVRRPKIRVRHKLGSGSYLAKATGRDRYGRRLVVRVRSRLRR
jgi:ABC-2 type transport system ATP-binding protein